MHDKYPGKSAPGLLRDQIDIEIVPGRRLQDRHGGCQQFAAPLGASAIGGEPVAIEGRLIKYSCPNYAVKKETCSALQ